MSIIRMVHPSLPGQEWAGPDTAEPGFLRAGWIRADETTTNAAEQPEPAAEPTERASTPAAATTRRTTSTPASGPEEK